MGCIWHYAGSYEALTFRMHTHSFHKRGFSLIQVSVMVVVAGIIMASILPGGKAGSDVEKNKVTLERMQAIENATQSFMSKNYRRPCPADGTIASPGSAASATTSTFGVEAATNGTCTGGT